MEQIIVNILILKGSVTLLLIAGILNIVEERPVGILDTIVEGLWPSLLVLFFGLLVGIFGGLIYFLGWVW